MKLVYHPSILPFIDTLQKAARSRVMQDLQLLEDYGAFLRMPHSKHIENGIYELRTRGKQEVRLLYCFRNHNYYVLHGFVKKSQKTPRKEIKIALVRRVEI